MKRSVQPVTAGVTREDSPGPVAAMSARRQAYDQEPRMRVAEPRYGASPVDVIRELPLAFAGDVGAVASQAGA
ncbi:MAG TPA: hypothetical protein VFY42_02615 [Gemmatimonadales bacterium]|nr:hypothetical protein [Gemmatimonadales bacterium]